MKKITRGKLFVESQKKLFQCPVCTAHFRGVQGYSFDCVNGHCFNLSKKGSLYFLQGASKNEYNKEMLLSRYQIAQAGLFDGILAEIYPYLTVHTEEDTLLDVGCGEGSQLDFFSRKGIIGNKIGFDISKDGIELASTHFSQAFWCVADLAKSPFATGQYRSILNVFSPSNYQEFNRLLTKDGQLIKVVPGPNYLKELRELLYRDQKGKQEYSNTLVIEKFRTHFPKMTIQPISYTFKLTEENFVDLMCMTPLHWGATQNALIDAKKRPLKEITIDVVLLFGKK